MVHPPAEMVRSRELDLYLYPQLDPKRSVEAITLQLGQGSTFHRTNGFYANPIAPALLALPSDWQTRLAPISLAGGVVACFIDPNDAAIGKLMRGSDNDLWWMRAGLSEGDLNAGVILERSQ